MDPANTNELSLKFGRQPRYPDNAHNPLDMLRAAAEAMLEELLWNLLLKVGSIMQIAEVLMEQTQGRHKMLTLFNSLNSVKAPEVFEGHATLSTFMQYWDAPAKLRNEVAHGQRHYYYGKDPKTDKPLKPLEPVQRFRENFLAGFMELNNSMY